MIYGRQALSVRNFTPNYAYLENEVEVMQYSGLTDDNDTEIYAGDIYKTPSGLIGKVYMDEGAFWLGHLKRPYDDYELLVYAYRDGIKRGHVIGNIYENKELLGGEAYE